MENLQINSKTSDKPDPDPTVSVLTADENEKPKSIMLIASTDDDLINTCFRVFMNNSEGQHDYRFIGHVGEVYDPKQNAFCILLNTLEPYSESFLADVLSGLREEIYDPGIIDRESLDSQLND